MSTSEASLAFGEEVRRRRIAVGLTLPEFAARAGVSPNFIGGIELGKRDPALATAVKLAAGFGVPLGDLLGTPGLSPDVIEGAQHIAALPVEAREPIVVMLRALAAWAGRQP
ncbi:MAG TPA: helix-turn-helix transcriptional regulator [Polyangiaceae bacterium]|jgi:transcriptional regulator with XRE-family HTH domain|nr:helix-turn-helix transcriptional regulator [Polyangiaceae bacterium]